MSIGKAEKMENERPTEKIHMADLVPIICEVLDSDSEFRLYPRGRSMLPTIVEGKDSVMLARPENADVWDAVLYRRANGQFVLHRIVAEHGEFFDMCGDNQLDIEKNVPKNALIAKVTGIYKGSVYRSVTDPDYQESVRRLYAKKPFKRAVLRVKRVLYPLYRPIKAVFIKNK